MHRKRIAKLLSLLLSVTMVFTSANMPAMAAEVDETVAIEEAVAIDEVVEETTEEAEVVEEETVEDDEVIEDEEKAEDEEVVEDEEASEDEEDVEEEIVDEESEVEEGEEELTEEILENVETVEFESLAADSAEYLVISSTGELTGFNDAGKALESIDLVIPANVIKIAKSAFSGNKSIKSVKFAENSKLDEIGNSAFSECSNIESFVIPETVRTIGFNAFLKTGITEIILPSQLSSIGFSAFDDCTQLTAVTIYSNKIKIGTSNGIFKKCNISKITFGPTVTAIPDDLFCLAGITPGTEVVIPARFTRIGVRAFMGTNISKITFENGSKLDEIGGAAFSGCSKIESFVIPETVRTIGYNAFLKTGITEIILPSQLSSIGFSAFDDCTQLTAVTIYSNNIKIGTSNGIFKNCNISKITFGPTVTAIPDDLFCLAGITPGTEVVIPARFTRIGSQAFQGTNISKITFEEGTKLDEIGNSAFSECSNIESFVIPETVRTIGYNAFLKTGITEIILPSQLSSIGFSAFDDCTQLTAVTIYSNNIKIGTSNGIFKNCNISKITFGPKVTAIPDDLFSKAGFSGAAEIEIPSTIKTIGVHNFSECSHWMRTISLPSSITSIANYTFSGAKDYVTFKVVDGSYAHKWANEKGFRVQTVSGINYNLNGGSFAGDGTYPSSFVTSETGMISISDPVRTGYIFNGWYTDSACTKALSKGAGGYDFSSAKGTVTLFAKWTAITYTISFSENKPANAVDKVTVSTFTNINATYDKAITVPANRNTITRYAFTGWNTKADGTGTAYKPGVAVKNLTTENGKVITLYGQWKATTYSVKYDSNIGSITSKPTGVMNNTVMTFGNADNSIVANAFKANGYTFEGWNTRADGKGIAIDDGKKIGTLLEANYAKDTNNVVILYAQWKQIPYRVSLYLNDGSAEKIATVDVEYGQKLSDAIEAASVSVIRNGYTLSSWNTLANGKGKKYIPAATNITASGEEVTLYAQWTGPVAYKIAYDLDGGKNHSKNLKTYKVNTESFALETPTKVGFTFEGWKLIEGNVKGAAAESIITSIPSGSYGNVKVKAMWSENVYKVVFHGANEQYTDVTADVEVNVPYTAFVDLYNPTLSYTRKGDVTDVVGITSWTSLPNGKGKVYAVGKAVSKLSAANFDGTAGKVELYAKWGAPKYRIEYELNGGTNNKSNPVVYTYNTRSAVSIKAPTRPGYVFAGWSDLGMDEITDKYQIAKGTTGEISIEAHWIPLKYTVNINLNSKTAKAIEGTAMSYKASTDGTGEDVSIAFAIAKGGKPVFTNAGYMLTGFNTKANGKGIQAAVNADGSVSLENLSAATADSRLGIKVVLYAQWKPIDYTITYVNIDPDDSEDTLTGVTNKNVTSYNVTKAITLSNPTRSGFVFQGWYSDKECKNRVTRINKGTTENMVLYGKWIIK